MENIMPKLTVNVPHQLDPKEVTSRLQGILEKMKERFQGQISDLKDEWQGDVLNFSFKTFGFGIKGAMHVEPQQVRVDADLPFAAMMFKGRIEQELKSTLERWLT
jgi:putative polyhydroxyalkanoate system protein